MRVVHVASEAAPFAQSGGLADVLGGLPLALAARGIEVGVVMPLYRGVDAKIASAGVTLAAPEPITVQLGPQSFAGALRVGKVGPSGAQVTFGFLDCPPLYDRDGGMYGPTGSSDWGDNHLRFGFLGKAALEHGGRLVGHASPDILHVHDWQGAPAAIFARAVSAPHKLVTTIHNLAYRGIFPKSAITDLGLPWSSFQVHDVEFYDQVSFLKGGMAAADVVTTVSPSYAAEILTPKFGEALDGFLRTDVKRLVGIVNGIDTESWNPATDRVLAATFSASSLAGKATCRTAIADELGLAPLSRRQPLIAVIARMTGQKGLDLVADIIPELHRLDAKLIVLGSGEAEYESRFRYLAETFREHVALYIGFDTKLSRRIYAGSDLFLMPSRFEPCGLGQMYAMRYGSLPVVHAVGGLRDTVSDDVTGFAFASPTAESLLGALERAVAAYRNPKKLRSLRQAAMSRDSSWAASADEYIALYRSLL